MPIPVLDFRRLTPEEYGSPLSSAISGLLGGLQNGQEMKSKRLSDMLVQKQMEEHEMRNKYLEPNLQAQLAQEQGRASALPGQLKRQEEQEGMALALARLGLKQKPQQFNQEQAYNQEKLKQLQLENQFYPQIQQMKQMQSMQGQNKFSRESDIKEYNKAFNEANSAAEDAAEFQGWADMFKQSYENAPEVGRFKGKLPAISSEAVNAQKASDNMQAIMAKMLSGRVLTNQELKFAGGLKFSRDMPKESVDELYDFLSIKGQRISEKAAFLEQASEMGIPEHKAQTMFRKYDNERPIYDFKSKKPLSENLGTWEDFLNPEKSSKKRWKYSQQTGALE
jgi:hypothetical protein